MEKQSTDSMATMKKKYCLFVPDPMWLARRGLEGSVQLGPNFEESRVAPGAPEEASGQKASRIIQDARFCV